MAGQPPQSGRTTTAVVLAGGSGRRLGAPVNKVFLPLGGVPVLRRCLDVLEGCTDVSAIVLVVRPGDRRRADVVLDPPPAKLRTIVDGGATRHASEERGLAAVADLEPTDLVAIHDGARPLVTRDLIERLLAAAVPGGAVPGIAFDRHVVADRGGIAVPVDADALRRMQTPQVFRRDVLLTAYDAAAAVGFEGLDTCDTVQRFADVPVAVVAGDPANLKITYGDDLARAAAILRQAEAATNGTERPSTTVPKTMRP